MEKSGQDGQPKREAFVLLSVLPESAAQRLSGQNQFSPNKQKAIVQDPPLGGPAQIVLVISNILLGTCPNKNVEFIP